MAVGNKGKEEKHDEEDFEDTGAEAGMVDYSSTSEKSNKAGDVGGYCGNGYSRKTQGSIDIYDKYTLLKCRENMQVM